MTKPVFHTHKDENGILVRCYHECKSLFTDWKFFAGVTFSYPLEHALWERAPIFSDIAHWLGLMH